MIELIVLDVDGTLTDGSIIYGNDGEELKSFDVKDGLAVATWTKKLGKKAAIITGRNSQIVERRAKDLNITHIYQGVHNKLEVLQQILEEENLSMKNVAVIGDDLNDYTMLKAAGISFVPSDASSYVQHIAKVVCKSKGGKGAVREMIEYIVRYDAIEEEFINVWL